MKRVLTFVLAAAAVVAVGVTTAQASPRFASLRLDHFVRGCHNWSLNGGSYHAHQVVQLARGGTLFVTNNDLMVQDLVKTRGPKVTMKLVRDSHMGSMPMVMEMEGKPSPYAMSHMGARLKVTFPTAGTYRFKLVDRGDYFKNIKTVGPDNKPTLVVKVA